MRTLRVGIASYEEMKARTLAIARGEHKPAAGEPKVWFTSAESFAKVLSDRNRALLAIIAESAPDSLARLAELSGRRKPNLSRTLKTMERYGFVRLSRGARGSVIPRVPYQRISLTLPLSRPGTEAARSSVQAPSFDADDFAGVDAEDAGGGLSRGSRGRDQHECETEAQCGYRPW